MSGSANQPNLLLIGFPRCGTTAFARALDHHDDISICSPKEPHFLAFEGGAKKIKGPGAESFGPSMVYSEPRWHALFEKMITRYRCDASVSTISYPNQSIGNIKNYCSSDVKFIVMLRDPIERAHSSYQYNLSRGWFAGTFEEGLANEDQRFVDDWSHLWFYTYLSRYEKRLDPFFQEFGREAFFLVTTEEFSKSPQACLNRCFDFLGLPSFDIDTSAQVNRGGKPRFKIFANAVKVVRRKPALLKFVKSFTTHRFRERFKQLNLQQEKIKLQTLQALREELSETYTWVENELGGVPNDWKR